MAKALAQSRRRILPFLTPSRGWLEQPLDPSTWLLKPEAQPPNISCVRLLSMQVNAPAQARQMGALQVSMTSPGFVYEPYTPREPISFLYRYFTRSGWKRTKDDLILECLCNCEIEENWVFKKKFYEEAVDLYKEINTQIANGEKGLLRKSVTEKMYSAIKNEIKEREKVWSRLYWEMLMPIVKIRTLRARLIGVDRNDLNKVFVQLTLEFLSKQKFEAYDSSGAVVAGNKDKEVLVRDIWVLRNPFSTKERFGVFVDESKFSCIFPPSTGHNNMLLNFVSIN